METEQQKAEALLGKRMQQQTAMIKPIKSLLLSEGILSRLASTIPAGLQSALTPERCARLALGAVQNSSALQKCDPISIAGSVMQAAQLGLVIDGVLGHCYLVPFKGQAQFILGYKGMGFLAYRTDKIGLRGRVVRKGEVFEVHEGTERRLIHQPGLYDGTEDEKDLPPIIAAYGVAEMPDGRRDFRVLPVWELRKAQKVSKAGRDDSPWRQWYQQMCEKTAIRRQSQQTPLSPDVAVAIRRDEAVESGHGRQVYSQTKDGAIECDFETIGTATEEPPQLEQGFAKEQ